jgi:hypothetical protein
MPRSLRIEYENAFYHLLIETPNANLSRVMRHINGVYTQRYNPLEGYRHYVMRGVDEQTKRFQTKGNVGTILGDETFKLWAFDELMPQLAAEGKNRMIHPNLSMPIVVQGVGAYYKTTPEALLKCTRGPQHGNEPRKVAMYLSQELSAARLMEIAGYFNLNHYGSVGFTTHQIRQRKMEDHQFERKLSDLIKGLIKFHS